MVWLTNQQQIDEEGCGAFFGALYSVFVVWTYGEAEPDWSIP